MNYGEALKFVHSRQKFGSRPGLDNIRRITELCNWPQRDMRFIHVAGTNGKGSVSTMLSNIMIASGQKTGLFISPYVVDFRERIQINGQMISKTDFAEIIERLAPLVEQTDGEGFCVTEFELITCAAFMYFKEKKCDCVVLEVGMGGRLDATNIIENPLAAVITRIDLDHTAVLGDTAEEIAAEKCGIIKRGSPTVMYPDQYEGVSEKVASVCAETESRLVIPPTDFYDENRFIDGSIIEVGGIKVQLPLIGRHQQLNAATVISTALEIGVAPEHIVKGIKKTAFAARMELINRSPIVILDGAHNPNGAKALASALDACFGEQKAVAIMGMLADKDAETAIEILSDRFSHIITLTVPNPRTMSAAELKQKALKHCPSVYSARSYIEAIRLADKLSCSKPIVICGSLYLAAAIRPKLLKYFK